MVAMAVQPNIDCPLRQLLPALPVTLVISRMVSARHQIRIYTVLSVLGLRGGQWWNRLKQNGQWRTFTV